MDAYIIIYKEGPLKRNKLPALRNIAVASMKCYYCSIRLIIQIIMRKSMSFASNIY